MKSFELYEPTTVQQAVGVPISSFGTESNRTSKTITEVMA